MATQVFSMPAGDDGYDHHIVCVCGWCSLPLVRMPALADMACPACDERARGLRRRLALDQMFQSQERRRA